MKVSLIGNKTLNRIILPQKVNGNYWICDEYDEKLVNIYSENDEWKINSNLNVKIINPKYIKFIDGKVSVIQEDEAIIDSVALSEYTVHCLCIGDYESVYILYCSPRFEKNIRFLDTGRIQEISIGNEVSNQIYYNNNLVKNVQAKLKWVGNQWNLEDFGSMFGTFVNGKPINRDTIVLKNGDTIFIMGLIIVILGKNIYINNPFNKVIINTMSLSDIQSVPFIQSTKSELEEEQQNIEIYSDEDYFFRFPRIAPSIEIENVRIDNPSSQNLYNEKSVIATLGRSISMGVVMMVALISGITAFVNGSTSAITRIISSIAMLFGMLIFPIIIRKSQKKQHIKDEEKRQYRYKQYLNSRMRLIEEIIAKQKSILKHNYLSTEECMKIIFEKNSHLWERRLNDKDFLTIRLGTGDMPAYIDIKYPDDDKFELETDNLITTAKEMGEKAKIIKDVPITFSLLEKRISAVVSSDKVEIEKFLQRIIIQLIALHSYQELKLVFAVKESGMDWDYVKILPHTWEDKTRFFADSYSEMQELSVYLNDKMLKRIENKKERENDGDKDKIEAPYYLIITDDYEKIENLNIVSEIMKNKEDMGFGILCVANELTHLPEKCENFIYLNGKDSTIYEREGEDLNTHKFSFDDSETFFVDKISKAIANIPLRVTTTEEIVTKKSFGFLEMFNAGKIEHLNVLGRWSNNDSTKSLKAQIGFDSNNMPIYLDLHEKFHGPHGLIAGSTGSGKSEFIITYILSLAINYSPDDVTFVLIDYKGGGLAGAFQKGDLKLPHLVGSITNIDTNNLERSLLSIKSELTRRQRMFNEARNLIDEGTIDIYKYQKLYKQGVIKKPISHLMIICDEFAELKQQQPEFMEELMSVSRIGRSLGVHLILATQKPAGIVNDQIRSNSKFGICLKVQDRSDSNDVIQKPDAAYLKNPGQFYLNVGNEEYFVSGQSAWSGAPYYPKDIVKEKADTSIEFISNTGATIIDVDNDVQINSENNKGEQLTNIVKYLAEIVKQTDIKTERLWLDPIPETIYLEDLKKKYKVKKEENAIIPVIGELDDPNNQRQDILKLDISGGNTLIYGNAESGKETLLNTIIYESITSYSTENLWIYILDYGSESLRIYNGCPHVGEIILSGEDEKCYRFFEMIQEEIKNRKDILAQYNGDLSLYLKTSNKPMPYITIIINNYDVFTENYNSKFDELMMMISREGIKYGIDVIITASMTTSIRYRLAQNFNQKIALQMNKETDYASIIEKLSRRRTLPRMFGRGFIGTNSKEIYEFQTAKVCDAGEWNVVIKNKIEEIKKNNKLVAKKVPILPDIFTFEQANEEVNKITSVPVGIDKFTLKMVKYDFKNTFITLFLSKEIEEAAKYASKIAEEIDRLKGGEVKVLDNESILENIPDKIIDIDTFINDIESQDTDNKGGIYILIGIGKLNTKLKEKGKELKQLLATAENSKKYSFIFVENPTIIKGMAFEEWYKLYAIGSAGIWVGDGVNEQYTMSFNIDRRILSQKYGSTFGYVTKKNKANLIKLLEMEEGEENE